MENINKTDIEKIKEIINDIRPFLNMDGGDIEFISYDAETSTVYVKLYGACAMCMAQDETLENNILEAIKEQVPSVQKIINTPL